MDGTFIGLMRQLLASRMLQDLEHMHVAVVIWPGHNLDVSTPVIDLNGFRTWLGGRSTVSVSTLRLADQP